jgi:hypothetical protein
MQVGDTVIFTIQSDTDSGQADRPALVMEDLGGDELRLSVHVDPIPDELGMNQNEVSQSQPVDYYGSPIRRNVIIRTATKNVTPTIGCWRPKSS